LEEVKEQVEAWVAVAEEDAWEEIVQAQARQDIACAQAAEKGFLISGAHPAIL
jgi:hypothetical protein